MNEQMVDNRQAASRQPRAHMRAPALEVVSVKPLPGSRRVPKALVTVRIGSVFIACSFARYRRGNWAVMYPMGTDGKEGVRLPPKVEAKLIDMVKAAAEADPAARKRLMDRYW